MVVGELIVSSGSNGTACTNDWLSRTEGKIIYAFDLAVLLSQLCYRSETEYQPEPQGAGRLAHESPEG
jgi:hypothetical protein